jgi:small subunit ribosomal protein S9
LGERKQLITIECSLQKISFCFFVAFRTFNIYSIFSVMAAVSPRVQHLKAIGRSLEKYLKKANNHAVMMEREKYEFERGKRHLANIMGWDKTKPIKQEDIDSAISYLFPSSLTDTRAVPVMKPPEEIMPKFSTFEFDEEGRPKDTLFYTLRPKFYSLLSVS